MLTYEISLPDIAYEDGDARLAFFETHLERVRALPGVISAAAIDVPPLGGHNGWFFEIEDAPPEDPDAPRPVTSVRIASTDYIETMGITLLTGRSFSPADGRDEGSTVVIVNETFARRFWENQVPLGKTVFFQGNQSPSVVVGVVRDARYAKDDLASEATSPHVWVPRAQSLYPSSHVHVRSRGDQR